VNRARERDRVERPIEGNPSLTVGAPIGNPKRERVGYRGDRFFMKFRGRNAHPNRVERPIEGNPSLTVGAPIRAPSVSEWVKVLSFS
jgi:hypothetical protein